MVDGDEAEVRQAVCSRAAAGGVDQLEQRIPAATQASVDGGTEHPQLTQPDRPAHG
jgi:hypothetical protein